MHLLFATRNPHKAAEFAQMLGGEFEVSNLCSAAQSPEVEETGATFEENAILKAVAASRMTNVLVVADDSGLEVETLGGAPGVRSARYAGEHATDSENVAKLLAELRRAGGNASGAKARFYCALAFARSGVTIGTVAGEVRGSIVNAPAGEGGFGYDPVFVPEGFKETFAQLGAETKNLVSHRAKAVAELRRHLLIHPAEESLAKAPARGEAPPELRPPVRS